MLHLRQAATPAEIESARTLFREYGASLGFSLCFQSFDQELASLPGDYAPPRGRLLMAHWLERNEDKLAGCVALHPLGDTICEMKRLYVRPGFRGKSIGRALVHAAIGTAREIGYSRMRLDTIPSVMSTAVEIYNGIGFRPITAYRANPIPGAIYMELEL